MYSYKWNKRTGGYTLTPETGKFVASELRPVYAQEKNEQILQKELEGLR